MKPSQGKFTCVCLIALGAVAVAGCLSSCTTTTTSYTDSKGGITTTKVTSPDPGAVQAIAGAVTAVAVDRGSSK